MTDLEFSRDDIENLAQKLDSPQSQLSEHERALLLAIFAAASDRVRPSHAEVPGDAAPTLASLREQLLVAFIPGDDAEFIISIKIGPGN